MARAATELVDILKALVEHYVAADRYSRDGIGRPRESVAGAGDGNRLQAMAA